MQSPSVRKSNFLAWLTNVFQSFQNRSRLQEWDVVQAQARLGYCKDSGRVGKSGKKTTSAIKDEHSNFRMK